MKVLGQYLFVSPVYWLLGLVSFLIASASPPSLLSIAIFLIGLWLLLAGARSFNQWLEREKDKMISRKAGRPLPSGGLEPTTALVLSLLISIVGLGTLSIWFGALTGAAGAFGWSFYILAYTVIAKGRTTANLLIGNVATALIAVVGWAAAGSIFAAGSLLLVALVTAYLSARTMCLLVSTPQIARDYVSAGVPIITLESSGKAIAFQIAGYACAATGCAIALVPQTGEVTWVLIGVLLLCVSFLTSTGRFVAELLQGKRPGRLGAPQVAASLSRSTRFESVRRAREMILSHERALRIMVRLRHFQTIGFLSAVLLLLLANQILSFWTNG